MKKQLSLLVSLLVIAAMMFSLASCDLFGKKHAHTFSDTWSNDATDHWHAATCEDTDDCKSAVSDKAAHTPGADGACTVCGYKAEAPHTHVFEGEYTIVTQGTCTANATGYKSCSCGEAGETVEIPDSMTDHTWSKDYTIETPATCTQNAKGYKTCSCGAKDATVEIEGTAGHTPDTTAEPTIVEAGTCLANAKGYYKCSVCQNDCEVVEIPDTKTAHAFEEIVDDEFLLEEATAEAPAEYSKSCGVCGKVSVETFTYIGTPTIAGTRGEGVYYNKTDDASRRDFTNSTSETEFIENGVWSAPITGGLVVTSDGTDRFLHFYHTSASNKLYARYNGTNVTEALENHMMVVEQDIAFVGNATATKATYMFDIWQGTVAGANSRVQMYIDYTEEGKIKFQNVLHQADTYADLEANTWYNIRFELYADAAATDATVKVYVNNVYALTIDPEYKGTLTDPKNNTRINYYLQDPNGDGHGLAIDNLYIGAESKALEHKYVEVVDEAYVVTAPTQTTPGVYYKSCEYCGKAGTETFEYQPVYTHTHTFSESWSFDATGHWHAATCNVDGEDCSAVRDAFAAHTLVDGVCSACPYKAPTFGTGVYYKDTTITTLTRYDINGATLASSTDNGVSLESKLHDGSETDKYAIFKKGDCTSTNPYVYLRGFEPTEKLENHVSIVELDVNFAGYTKNEAHAFTFNNRVGTVINTGAGAPIQIYTDKNGDLVFNPAAVTFSSATYAPMKQGNWYNIRMEIFVDNGMANVYIDNVYAVTYNYSISGYDTNSSARCNITIANAKDVDASISYDNFVMGHVYKEFELPGHTHKFEGDFVIIPATCVTNAKQYQLCACGAQSEATEILNTATGHTYSTDWSSNETDHWHAATCNGSDECKTLVTDKAVHTFENGACKECGYIYKDPNALPAGTAGTGVLFNKTDAEGQRYDFSADTQLCAPQNANGGATASIIEGAMKFARVSGVSATEHVSYKWDNAEKAVTVVELDVAFGGLAVSKGWAGFFEIYTGTDGNRAKIYFGSDANGAIKFNSTAIHTADTYAPMTQDTWYNLTLEVYKVEAKLYVKVFMNGVYAITLDAEAKTSTYVPRINCQIDKANDTAYVWMDNIYLGVHGKTYVEGADSSTTPTEPEIPVVTLPAGTAGTGVLFNKTDAEGQRYDFSADTQLCAPQNANGGATASIIEGAMKFERVSGVSATEYVSYKWDNAEKAVTVAELDVAFGGLAASKGWAGFFEIYTGTDGNRAKIYFGSDANGAIKFNSTAIHTADTYAPMTQDTWYNLTLEVYKVEAKLYVKVFMNGVYAITLDAEAKTSTYVPRINCQINKANDTAYVWMDNIYLGVHGKTYVEGAN